MEFEYEGDDIEEVKRIRELREEVKLMREGIGKAIEK